MSSRAHGALRPSACNGSEAPHGKPHLHMDVEPLFPFLRWCPLASDGDLDKFQRERPCHGAGCREIQSRSVSHGEILHFTQNVL